MKVKIKSSTSQPTEKPEPPMFEVNDGMMSGLEGLTPGAKHCLEIDGEVLHAGKGIGSYDQSGKGHYAKFKIHSVRLKKDKGTYESASKEAKEKAKGTS